MINDVGHVKTATFAENDMQLETQKNDESSSDGLGYKLVSRVIKYIDKGYNVDRIRKKTGADRELIEDINRMYLTHPGVSIQGILDRIEIKNR